MSKELHANQGMKIDDIHYRARCPDVGGALWNGVCTMAALIGRDGMRERGGGRWKRFPNWVSGSGWRRSGA